MRTQNNNFFERSSFLYLLFPLFLSLFVRKIFFCNLIKTPFLFYNEIRGLDMFSLLHYKQGLAFNNYVSELLQRNEFAAAEKLLKTEYDNGNRSYEIAINYASALLGLNKYSDAFKVLSKIAEPINDFRQRTY